MAKNYNKLKEKYAEWLAYKTMGKMGEKYLKELGYVEFTKKEFCEKNHISKDTPRNWESNLRSNFWEIYYEKVQNAAKVDLPAVMKVLAKKTPQDWLKVMFPKQAYEAFKQKHVHTGGITIEDTKKMLGDSFEIIEEENRGEN